MAIIFYAFRFVQGFFRSFSPIWLKNTERLPVGLENKPCGEFVVGTAILCLRRVDETCNFRYPRKISKNILTASLLSSII
ncbi:MAG: hypothetical protein LBJ95_01900 [Oscillospiraceae bacterium]|nr:hypothetical protein [Oscillospiraceae bacterium]